MGFVMLSVLLVTIAAAVACVSCLTVGIIRIVRKHVASGVALCVVAAAALLVFLGINGVFKVTSIVQPLSIPNQSALDTKVEQYLQGKYGFNAIIESRTPISDNSGFSFQHYTIAANYQLKAPDQQTFDVSIESMDAASSDFSDNYQYPQILAAYQKVVNQAFGFPCNIILWYGTGVGTVEHCAHQFFDPKKESVNKFIFFIGGDKDPGYLNLTGSAVIAFDQSQLDLRSCPSEQLQKLVAKINYPCPSDFDDTSIRFWLENLNDQQFADLTSDASGGSVMSKLDAMTTDPYGTDNSNNYGGAERNFQGDGKPV
jgi:hypothetical protein